MRVRPLLAATLLLIPAPCLALAGSLSFTPGKVEFGVQAVNSESQPATVTVSNQTSQSVELTEVITSGIDFVAANHCKNQLAAGAQCSIQIRFKPLIPGDRFGVIEILASDSPNPHFVTLIGKGR